MTLIRNLASLTYVKEKKDVLFYIVMDVQPSVREVCK